MAETPEPEQPWYDETPKAVIAGAACTRLIAEPATWINRRVETVELLTGDETRRKVSVDFTLTEQMRQQLEIADGVVVPITVLTKERRRSFDLRDETGRAIPVLGKGQNGDLAHIALMNAAFEALPDDVTDDASQMLAADLRRVVFDAPGDARDALEFFAGAADAGDPVRAAIWHDDTCRQMLGALWENYVLFAVLAPGGPARRVLKYGYSEDFNPMRSSRLADRLALGEVLTRLAYPDRAGFLIATPGASWAASFHVEVAVPDELRIERAFLFERDAAELISGEELNVNRASLYAPDQVAALADVDAYVEVAPERRGATFQAAATSLVVTALLWLGVVSELDAEAPGAAVSLLLAGAALFTGFAAAQHEHRLVTTVFSTARRGLGVVTLCALTGSATLAMEFPCRHPVFVWWCAAALSSIVALRLAWSAVRAPT